MGANEQLRISWKDVRGSNIITVTTGSCPAWLSEKHVQHLVIHKRRSHIGWRGYIRSGQMWKWGRMDVHKLYRSIILTFVTVCCPVTWLRNGPKSPHLRYYELGAIQ